MRLDMYKFDLFLCSPLINLTLLEMILVILEIYKLDLFLCSSMISDIVGYSPCDAINVEVGPVTM